jgi:methionine aminotransferase
LSYAHLSDENDREYANRLTIDYKIASIPISVFYHNYRDDKILRFCFAKTNETLEKGVEGLMKVK